MKKTKNKKVTAKPFALSKRAEETLTVNGFGVILEEFREIFKGLGDGQKILFEQMGRVEGRMDNMENRMSGMENRMSGMENDIRDMKDSLKTIMEYLSRIDDEIRDIKVELSKKADKREIEDRVLKIELELLSIRNMLNLQNITQPSSKA